MNCIGDGRDKSHDVMNFVTCSFVCLSCLTAELKFTSSRETSKKNTKFESHNTPKKIHIDMLQ